MKFSVLIPSYKAIYLSEAIESVLSQIYKDFELIIVDDASPEDIFSIVNSFSDDRIRYYRNSHNYGADNLVDNWNKGLQYCNGDYIINMGDDDKMLPNCLSVYNELITKYPESSVYHAKTQIIDEESNVYMVQDSRPERESAYSMIYHQFVYNRIQYMGDFCISKRWLIENNGYISFPLAYSSDWATANKAALHGGIVNGNEFSFQYRVSRHSISRSQNLKKTVDSLLKAWMWYRDFIMNDENYSANDIYKELSKEEVDKYFKNTLRSYIYSDLSRNRFDFVSYRYWIVNCSKYKIRIMSIMKMIFASVLKII